MPLTYDQLSAITQKKFLPKLYDNIFDSNPLLKRLKQKSYKKLDGGLSIMVPLNYAQVTASGWFSGSDTLDTTESDEMTAAEYSWKNIYASITVTGTEELKNSGDSQILDLVKEKTKIAEKTIADSLGTGLYNAGTDAKAIGGLRLIVNTSSTVGGISQTTYSWWAAGVDSTTTTLSISAMQSRMTALTVDNEKPSVIATTRANFDRYFNLLQPQMRFIDTKTADAGFDSLLFSGAPVVPDSHAPSGYMYFLNENNLMLAVHKDRDMKFEPFAKPINQDVRTAKIFWMGNLVSSNNRLHGAMTALTA